MLSTQLLRQKSKLEGRLRTSPTLPDSTSCSVSHSLAYTPPLEFYQEHILGPNLCSFLDHTVIIKYKVCCHPERCSICSLQETKHIAWQAIIAIKKINIGSVYTKFRNHLDLSLPSSYHYSQNKVSGRITWAFKTIIQQVLWPLDNIPSEVTVKAKEAKRELLKSTEYIWQCLLAANHIRFLIFNSFGLVLNQGSKTYNEACTSEHSNKNNTSLFFLRFASKTKLKRASIRNKVWPEFCNLA